MKKVALAIVCVALLVTIQISCKKMSEKTEQNQESILTLAKQEFYNDKKIKETWSENKFKLTFQPQWEKARIKGSSANEVIIVPIKFDRLNKIKSNFGDTSLISLDKISYLQVFKDKTGKFNYRVITLYPDADFIKSDRTVFSGYLHVDDCAGNYIDRYRFTNGHIYKQKTKPGNEVVDSKYKTNQTISITTCDITEVYGWDTDLNQWVYDETIINGCSTQYIEVAPSYDWGTGSDDSNGGGQTGPDGTPLPQIYADGDVFSAFEDEMSLNHHLCGSYKWVRIGERGLYASFANTAFSLRSDNGQVISYNLGGICIQFSTANVPTSRLASDSFNDLWNTAIDRVTDLINLNKLPLGQWYVESKMRQIMQSLLANQYGSSASMTTSCNGVPNSSLGWCQ